MVGSSAMLIGSALGAGSSLLSATTQSGAMEDAAALQHEATMAGIEEQRRQFDQIRTDFGPYRDIGETALGEYAALWGIGPGGLLPQYASDVTERPANALVAGPTASADPYASIIGRPMPAHRLDAMGIDVSRNLGKTVYKMAPQPGYDGNPADDRYIYYGAGTGGGAAGAGGADTSGGGVNSLLPGSRSMEEARNRFMTTPGYEFRVEEGIRALDRSAAARGGLGSGGYGRDLERFGQGIATEEFRHYADRLGDLAQRGQAAAGQTASAGMQSSGNIVNALTSGARAQGDYLSQAGTARASGYVGAANALNSGVNNYMFYDWLNRQSPVSYGGGTEPWMMY